MVVCIMRKENKKVMNREEAEKILTHGEWFYAESFDGVYKGIFKHDEIISGGWFDFIKFIRCVVLVGTAIVEQYYEHDSKAIIRIDVRYIKELRPATKQEVLKYFPDEVLPEPKSPRKRPITRNKKQYILR